MYKLLLKNLGYLGLTLCGHSRWFKQLCFWIVVDYKLVSSKKIMRLHATEVEEIRKIVAAETKQREKQEAAERKEKIKTFKLLNQVYKKGDYSHYIKLVEEYDPQITFEGKSKYFSWAGLILKGSRDSMVYIGKAASINPISVNDITTSIIISAYPNQKEIKKYLRKKAIASKSITQITYCYVVLKFDGMDALVSLSRKKRFIDRLTPFEQLELFYLMNDFEKVILFYEANVHILYSSKCYERIYDSYTRLGQLNCAEKIFVEADSKHGQSKKSISMEINPHVINNKLERHFWFTKGDLKRAYNTYKRQRLSQILSVCFLSKYSQNLQDIIEARSPLILASWGPGDELRFSGLYDFLVKLNKSITISCDPRLYDLLQWRFPDVKFRAVKRTRRVSVEDQEEFNCLPHSKLHHIMDNKLYSTMDEFDVVSILTDVMSEVIVDYLQAPQADFSKLPPSRVAASLDGQVRKLRKKNKRLIGLSWRSSIETIGRDEHYFDRGDLAPLLCIKDAVFVNLQYGDCSEEVEQFRRCSKSEFVDLDVDQFNDFLSVYYIMQHLDVIVTAGTTVLELAGLSGTETFVLTNHHALKARIGENNKDIWFSNVRYVENMVDFTKAGIAAEIKNKIVSKTGVQNL